jgi:hypothetical protein
VFFSYSRAELRLVQAIAREVRLRGLQTWMDVENLRPGETWRAAIEKALGHAQLFVWCASARSVESAWTSIELDTAVRAGITIVPVLLEAVPIEALPPAIARRQAIDASKAHVADIPRVVAASIAAAASGDRLLWDAARYLQIERRVLSIQLSTATERAHRCVRRTYAAQASPDAAVLAIDGLAAAAFADIVATAESMSNVEIHISAQADRLQAALLIGALAARRDCHGISVLEEGNGTGELRSISRVIGARYALVPVRQADARCQPPDGGDTLPINQ